MNNASLRRNDIGRMPSLCRVFGFFGILCCGVFLSNRPSLEDMLVVARREKLSVSSKSYNNNNHSNRTNTTSNRTSSAVHQEHSATVSRQPDDSNHDDVSRNSNTDISHYPTTTTKISTTILLMADSRSLDVDDYHRLALIINAHYAKLHNYSIHFVHTPCLNNDDDNKPKECIACHHSQHGGRMTPWCKILAINETLHQFYNYHHHQQLDSSNIIEQQQLLRIVYLDSDAIVRRLDQPLPGSYFAKTLNLFANPKDLVPCTGIQMWHIHTTTTYTQARDMMTAWWESTGGSMLNEQKQLDANYYNTHHDYEQSVFHDFNSKLRHYSSAIHVIREPVREFNHASKGFFRHITKKSKSPTPTNVNNPRYQRMLEFIQQHNISMDDALSHVEKRQLLSPSPPSSSQSLT